MESIINANSESLMLKNISKRWKKQRKLVDEKPPSAPYYLSAEDLLIHKDGREIFVKHVFSVAKDLPDYGPVIMSPGVSTNGNLFRVDDNGKCHVMDHNRSFANLLASEGFDVYLYHPGFSDRVYNRYVSRHCKDSNYYNRRYRVSAQFGYGDLINFEVPALIDYVCTHSKSEEISWVGFSLGGMIAYSYLAKNIDNPIKNLVTIGSPMALNQMFYRFVHYINFTSTLLGLEEDAFLGNLTQNMVPVTRAIRAIPSQAIRYNPISPYLFNPSNISNTSVRTLLGQIVEPMPKELQKFFIKFVQDGYSPENKITNYLNKLRLLKESDMNFLFFYGTNDLLATPESVFLAREVISPNDPHNLVAARTSGHIDLIIGNNAMEQVWKPTLEWLKGKTGQKDRPPVR